MLGDDELSVRHPFFSLMILNSHLNSIWNSQISSWYPGVLAPDMTRVLSGNTFWSSFYQVRTGG